MNSPVRRPGGRSARVGAAVLDVVQSLLDEGAWPFTVTEIAERSGVRRETIYRRWGSLEALVVQTAIADVLRSQVVPHTGDVRADVRRWAQMIADSVSSGRGLQLIRSVVELKLRHGMAADFGIDEFIARRTDEVADVGTVAGLAIPLDLVVLYDEIVAPIYLRTLFGYSPVNVDELVDRALAANEAKHHPTVGRRRPRRSP